MGSDTCIHSTPIGEDCPKCDEYFERESQSDKANKQEGEMAKAITLAAIELLEET